MRNLLELPYFNKVYNFINTAEDMGLGNLLDYINLPEEGGKINYTPLGKIVDHLDRLTKNIISEEAYKKTAINYAEESIDCFREESKISTTKDTIIITRSYRELNWETYDDWAMDLIPEERKSDIVEEMSYSNAKPYPYIGKVSVEAKEEVDYQIEIKIGKVHDGLLTSNLDVTFKFTKR